MQPKQNTYLTLKLTKTVEYPLRKLEQRKRSHAINRKHAKHIFAGMPRNSS